MNVLKKAILNTIVFFDLMDLPLTIDQLHKYLWRFKCHRIDLKKILKQNTFVNQKKDYFFLKDRSKLIEIQKIHQKTNQKLWKKSQRYLRILHYLPFIKMVAIANTLAFGNPTPDSDIDLFIIINHKRFWLTRLLITGLFHIMGIRRYGKKIKHRFCLSFFVTDQYLNFSKLCIDHNDIYLIYWIATLQCVIDNDMYKKFIQKNKQLLNKNLPNFKIPHPQPKRNIPPSKTSKITKAILNWILNGYIGNFLEKTIKKTLKSRSLLKMKHLPPTHGVIVTDHILKFHNEDQRPILQKKWKNKIKKLDI